MGYLHKREGGVDKEIFLMSVNHPKEGNIVLTCVKDNTTEEKEGL